MTLKIEKEQGYREEAYLLLKRYGSLLLKGGGKNNKKSKKAIKKMIRGVKDRKAERREVMKEIKKLAIRLNLV